MSRAYYDLYDRICHPLNIWWAYKAAARGKRYKPAAAFFEFDLEKNLIEIEQDLRDGTYQLGGYHNFRIDKPKRRLVNAAPFRDRVVHHALMNVIEPLFERQFIFDSYANRKGKGTQQHTIKVHRHRIHWDLFLEILACCEAARGSSLTTSFILRIGSGSSRRMPVSILAFVAPVVPPRRGSH